MITVAKSAIQASKRQKTAATLMRPAGLAAVATGLCFIGVGLFHQENIPTAVTTATWVNVHIAATAMGFLGLFGMAGLYARQAEKSGWLGLAGFSLFSVWLAIIIPFSFVEAFILPRLATETPLFVDGFLGMFSGMPSAINLDPLPTLWSISNLAYLAGPLMFGMATFRAGILPRWASAMFIVGATLGPVGALLVAPEYQSMVMIPNGLALIGLGHALWVERRDMSLEPLPDKENVTAPARKVA